jgi:hypothetical protein
MTVSLDCKDGQHGACDASGGCQSCKCHVSFTDNLATANALYDTASELRTEAWLWNTPPTREYVLASAVQCEETARAALRGLITLDVADAVAIAAERELAKIRAYRTFIWETYR